MKKILFLYFISTIAHSQVPTKTDSLVQLSEVILIEKRSPELKSPNKILSSIDEYLETSGSVSLIKRGAYAWEPFLNGMGSERIVTTIGGMQIFGACTDKMDPVTSYVETSNLSEINIHSGQSGCHSQASIGGSIDLIPRKATLANEKSFAANLQSGFETNNAQRIFMGNSQFSSRKIAVRAAASYRKADNYHAAKRTEILYSQFEKFNISTDLNIKISENKTLSADIIYDKAQDVGYPALPMDVGLAEALIGSVSFKSRFYNRKLKFWESKMYYNTVTHKMDDTQRPDVPIRMDMPGWSDTAGFWSKADAVYQNHTASLQISGFFNTSTAEMTMYPNNPAEKPMFMYTWPEVKTYSANASFNDKYRINSNLHFIFGGGLNFHHNYVASRSGYDSNRIFYPDMPRGKSRVLPSLNSSFLFEKEAFTITIGGGYGQRAPSVSEAYGFYLFNSFDRYDYIGNPLLKNETSYETNIAVSYGKKRTKIDLKTNYFHIKNYIAGVIMAGTPMTIGANGLKEYQSLPHANLLNISLGFRHYFSAEWLLKSDFGYASAKDNTRQNLPFVRPLSYSSEVIFSKNGFSASASVQGAATQTDFAPAYGEDRTPAYTVFNTSVSQSFINQRLTLQVGCENIFDRYYSTFADWNNIPRMGRNVFLMAKYSL
ncbi:MAG: TonB-dependent receptor [Capnocytophaga sp.]|nr:TonB-dependent receptor [Capnocytophaga sp.]